METTTTVVNLVRDGIDVAIRFSGDVGPGLRDEVLFDEEIIPVCAPSLLIERPIQDPSDLSHYTLIHIEGESTDPSWPDWAAWLEAAGVENVDPGQGLRFNQTINAAQAAKDGQGVALLGRTCLLDDLAAGRLVQPLPLGFPTTFAFRVVSTERSFDLPKVKAFCEWLRLEAAESLERAETTSRPAYTVSG